MISRRAPAQGPSTLPEGSANRCARSGCSALAFHRSTRRPSPAVGRARSKSRSPVRAGRERKRTAVDRGAAFAGSAGYGPPGPVVSGRGGSVVGQGTGLAPSPSGPGRSAVAAGRSVHETGGLKAASPNVPACGFRHDPEIGIDGTSVKTLCGRRAVRAGHGRERIAGVGPVVGVREVHWRVFLRRAAWRSPVSGRGVSAGAFRLTPEATCREGRRGDVARNLTGVSPRPWPWPIREARWPDPGGPRRASGLGTAASSCNPIVSSLVGTRGERGGSVFRSTVYLASRQRIGLSSAESGGFFGAWRGKGRPEAPGARRWSRYARARSARAEREPGTSTEAG